MAGEVFLHRFPLCILRIYLVPAVWQESSRSVSLIQMYPVSERYAALLRELSAIGNNINQIAHWTNGKGYATQAEIHEAVSLVKQAYRRILDTL